MPIQDIKSIKNLYLWYIFSPSSKVNFPLVLNNTKKMKGLLISRNNICYFYTLNKQLKRHIF